MFYTLTRVVYDVLYKSLGLVKIAKLFMGFVLNRVFVLI